MNTKVKYLRHLADLHPDQKGSVLVLVAVVIVALLGVSSLAVDLGALYKAKREMVNAADAAALAGARELEISKGANISEVPDVVYDYAVVRNKADSYTLNQTIPPVGTLTQYVDVTTTRHVDLFFARVLGIGSRDVSARAVASWGYVMGDRIWPTYINVDNYSYNPDGWDQTFHTKDTGVGGNWDLFNIADFIDSTDPIKEVFYDQDFSLDDPIVPNDGVDEESRTGFISSIVNGLANDKGLGNPDAYGRLYKYYLYKQDPANNPEVSMVGLLPIAQVFEPDSAGHIPMEIIGFQYYEIQDVIGSIPSKPRCGSYYATNKEDPPAGAILVTGSKGTYLQYPEDGDNYGDGTIIGRFVPDYIPNNPEIITDPAGVIDQTGTTGAQTGISLIE
jgi:hypothetical protein